jgi:hypothetical protein
MLTKNALDVQYRPVKSKLGAIGPSMAPTALDGPRRPSTAPVWPRMAPDGPLMAPDGSLMAPDGPLMALDGPWWPPTAPDGPWWPQRPLMASYGPRRSLDGLRWPWMLKNFFKSIKNKKMYILINVSIYYYSVYCEK